MHYHLEIIMPPTKNIDETIKKIMEPFSEHNEENWHCFYDWYVVGGRWAGTKLLAAYDEDKLNSFYKRLNEEKITVSGFCAGKQEISPADQIPFVDKLWKEYFPETSEDSCPIFKHSNNPYDTDDIICHDICIVEEIPKELAASRVIIAGPDYKEEKIEANYMISDMEYNGVNFTRVDWDQKVVSAIEKANEEFKTYNEEWIGKITPKKNWLCITVDYHS
jgi:hypothetical protein